MRPPRMATSSEREGSGVWVFMGGWDGMGGDGMGKESCRAGALTRLYGRSPVTYHEVTALQFGSRDCATAEKAIERLVELVAFRERTAPRNPVLDRLHDGFHRMRVLSIGFFMGWFDVFHGGFTNFGRRGGRGVDRSKPVSRCGLV